MFSSKLNPETLARLATKRKAEREARHADLILRLQKKIGRDGPNSIWAEMLAEQEAKE